LFACPASIILSGIVANFRDNRQLTAPEAWSCGLLFWFAKPKTAPASNHPWRTDFSIAATRNLMAASAIRQSLPFSL